MNKVHKSIVLTCFTILPIFFIFLFYLISQDIFAQDETQKMNVYEGLGLTMKYFDPWEITSKDDDPSCVDLCTTDLSTPGFKAMILINQEKFDKPEIKNKCKCDTLLEYVKYRYKIISENKDNVFINDNQTTLTDSNISAIQMEFENKAATLKDSIYIFIQNPNSFYLIAFATDKNEQQYSKYLNDFKKMLNSLEFVSANETNKQKQPSFMADNNNNETTTTVDNESLGVDLSDIKDKKTDVEINDINFDLFYSNPQSYISKKISITGKIFNIIPSSIDTGGIQIYHLGSQDKDTVISYSLSKINDFFNDEECVKIEGYAGPNYEYTNAFGAYRSSPMIFASSIQKIDCLDMVDPKAKIVTMEHTIEKGGIKVTLHKVEFDDKNTRAFLTVENTNGNEEDVVRFYDTSNSKAFQEKRQYEPQFSSSYPDISSEIPAGIEESGVVVFEPLQYGLDTKFQFEMGIGIDDYKFVFNTNTIGQESNQSENNQFAEDKELQDDDNNKEDKIKNDNKKDDDDDDDDDDNENQ